MPDAQRQPRSAPRISRAYAVLAMLFLFQTLNFFDKLVFGLSAVPMMADLSLSPRQYGLIGSSFFLLFSVSGVLVGLFGIGRIPTRWLLMVLAAIWSATQIPIFFSHSVAVLVTCRILLGLGEGPGLPSALHACYDWFPTGRRGVPSAVILQGISVGLLAGGPILTWLIVREGWRAGFLVCGLIGLAWMLAWLAIGAEGPFATDNARPAARQLTAPPPSGSIWLDRTVVGVILMSTASYWIVGMAATWLPPLLQQGLGYATMEVGWIISGVYAFQSPLLLLGSWIADAMLSRGWTRRTTLGRAAGSALIVSAAALALAFVTTGALRLCCVAVAFAAPSLTTIYGPMTLGAVAPDQRGRLIVVIYSGNAVSALASNAVTGWIVQSGGTVGSTAYAPAMLLTAAILMLGAIAAFTLIDPERTIARLPKAAPDRPHRTPPATTQVAASRTDWPSTAIDSVEPSLAAKETRP